ncbi:hypothetical protein DSO57_1007365 [Entomophthora muscae]|uniref:Uncharacterized protein n=1 Tax=Entomophthora muscae TaxID=34485 RepID=A0ACC2RYH4_9FUNG|nr:hypothetical protein DSO57_1007365 [Entomophthora muscae]
MLMPFAKFVVFTLAPALFLIWSTLLELWTFISSSAFLKVENPSHLLHLLDNLHGKAIGLLSTGETLICSLTCDDVEYALPTEALISCQYEDSHALPSVETVVLPPLNSMLSNPKVIPRCTPLLILDMLLRQPPELTHSAS